MVKQIGLLSSERFLIHHLYALYSRWPFGQREPAAFAPLYPSLSLDYSRGTERNITASD